MSQVPDGHSTPRWVPILVGCGIVCAVFLLAGLGLFLYGLYWFSSPGAQVPAATVVGPDSVGLIALDDAGRDPGIRALFTKAVVEMQKVQSAAQKGKVPPAVEWIQRWQMAQADWPAYRARAD